MSSDVASAAQNLRAATQAWTGIGGVYDEPLMQRYVDLGCRFLMAGADLAFMMSAGAKRTAFLNGLKT